MGDTGPCGPCTEIHIDLRSDAERAAVPGKDLVNNDHPQVIEIWNNVFMEFNRKADGSLEKLPAQHVDTGMGFERLCRAIEAKQSNYDTDVFMPYLRFLEEASGIKYGAAEKTDIAMRVLADHIRTISFAILDGQLPSNNGAGYVIRRILRRAVRYYYSFLNTREPLLYKMVALVGNAFEDIFPEVKEKKVFIENVIKEEEVAFLRTLENGIKRLERHQGDINGEVAFELLDTFGFPIDLTQLIAREQGMQVDLLGFEKNLQMQKERSRKATSLETEDWVVVQENDALQFIGYDVVEAEVHITRYRKVKAKGKEQFQLVLNQTPFYAESGGQVGDTGTLESANEKIEILDTQKENNLIIHLASRLPENPSAMFYAKVNAHKRNLTSSNHSATHLLHAALREVLGTHVEQKGSLVNPQYLRFDFSHFKAMSEEELATVAQRVNEKIRANIALDEKREVPIAEAKTLGAMALFGEKYGDKVRVITFDPNYSVELCGGTHVKATGEIGLFRFSSEAAVAAGVRRIEAITSEEAEAQSKNEQAIVAELKDLLKSKDLRKSIEGILEEKAALQKKLEALEGEKTQVLKQALKGKIQAINGINVLVEKVEIPNADQLKNLSFQLKGEIENLFCVLTCELNQKPMVSIILSENLVQEKNLNAGTMVKALAKHIQGGGGGQAFYATAGGNKLEGLDALLEEAKKMVN
jgi:alanyl-tRNA synthetase